MLELNTKKTALMHEARLHTDLLELHSVITGFVVYDLKSLNARISFAF